MNKFSNYSSVEINSKNCKYNSIFICFNNNLRFIDDAINNGATLIVTDQPININCEILLTKNINATFTEILNELYPIKSIKLIGITGTDGKTTTSLMIQSLLNQKSNCGYIGTNGIIYNNIMQETINTTLDIVSTRQTIYKMQSNYVQYVVMECSSEGIINNRLLSLQFDAIVYTNLSHEHLNSHHTMYNYFKVKYSLKNYLKENGKIITNYDDYYFKKIHGNNVYYYGFYKGDCLAFNIKKTFKNSWINFKIDNKVYSATIPFFGSYNIYNFLASVLTISKFTSIDNLNFSNINKVSGRFELINNNIVIDYAHTPNSLNCLLSNIKEITSKKIILVLGSQGEKDKSKRKLLGSTADKFCDIIIITSEDPKNEFLLNIFSDLIQNIKKKEYYLVLFRKDAIRLGLSLLNENYILVIVGKGLENSEQIYNYHFNHNDYLFTKSLLNS